MPLKFSFSVPNSQDLARGLKPRRLPEMWFVQGVVINTIGLGVGGVRIAFIDMDNTAAEPSNAISDSAGGFSRSVPSNNKGYRAQPCVEGEYIFCPAYFDFAGNSPIIRFTALRVTSKDDNHGK